jgi:hypothetical protein
MRQHTHPSSQIPSLFLSRSILLRNGSGSALFICRHYRKQRRSDSVSWEDIWHCERSQHRRDRFMELYQQQLRRLEPCWIHLRYPANVFQAQQFLNLHPSTQYLCVSSLSSLFFDSFQFFVFILFNCLLYLHNLIWLSSSNFNYHIWIMMIVMRLMKKLLSKIGIRKTYKIGFDGAVYLE